MNSAEGRREAPLGEMNSTLEGAMREKMPEKTAEKILPPAGSHDKLRQGR